MTQDTASIVYTITGKRADGSAINLTKTQSFSKSKVGATGTAGTNADAEPTVAAKDRRASKEFLDIMLLIVCGIFLSRNPIQ